MPRIYDCLLLDDDIDALEARMDALEGVPGLVHIICEAPVTDDGEPKPLHFQENRHTRFARFHGRWNHVITEPHEITGSTPQERRDSRREYILHGFHGDPQDIVFHGKLEDIPDPEVLEAVARRKRKLPEGMRRRKDITTIREIV
jgi:hypothetical protein